MLVGNLKCHCVGQRLTGAKVAGIPWMGAAGHNDADSVALSVTISGGPEFDVYVASPVIQRTGTMRANTDVAVADVDRVAIGSDVAEYQKKIGVFQAGMEKQFR